jgi:hypothetical protein
LRTIWAEMKASPELVANAGSAGLQAIVLDSLGHELGKQAVTWDDVTVREVMISTEFPQRAMQYIAYINLQTKAEVVATAKLWKAAKALTEYIEGKVVGDPIQHDLLKALYEAING